MTTTDLDQAITLYTNHRLAGLSKAEAKRRVYAALPGFKETVFFGTSLAPQWARRLQKIENDLPRDNGHTPDATPSHNGPNGPNGYSPTADMLAYLTDLDPIVGDQITLNIHYLAWTHKKANDAAWRYVFSDTGSLAREGWRFEVINKSGHCYQLRVLERPQTQQQREIDQLVAKANALLEEVARLRQQTNGQKAMF